eukprot:COSAG02_NODE_5350_length_4408_cov_48.603852_4_plen_85_part_00
MANERKVSSTLAARFYVDYTAHVSAEPPDGLRTLVQSHHNFRFVHWADATFREGCSSGWEPRSSHAFILLRATTASAMANVFVW